jgi:hypothetical protein
MPNGSASVGERARWPSVTSRNAIACRRCSDSTESRVALAEIKMAFEYWLIESSIISQIKFTPDRMFRFRNSCLA